MLVSVYLALWNPEVVFFASACVFAFGFSDYAGDLGMRAQMKHLCMKDLYACRYYLLIEQTSTNLKIGKCQCFLRQLKISRRTICAFALVLLFLSVTSLVFAAQYYGYTAKSIQAGLVILPLGDVNQDRIVNAYDLYRVARAYSSRPGDAYWDPDCDLNGDKFVDTIDLTLVADHYGESV